MNSLDKKQEIPAQCFVCGFSPDIKFKHLRHHEQWDLYQCPKCTFQFWWPIEQAPQVYFEKEYKIFADIHQKPNFGSNHKLALKLTPVKKGTILDVGCGDGQFVAKMNDRGFNVWGVDFNRRAIEKAKRVFNLNNLYPLSIYDFVKIPELPKFDLITFFEVLEHIGDPQKFIGVIKPLLINKGFIILSVPNAKRYGHWEETVNVPPHHITRWTEQTLRVFLLNNGFRIIILKKINRPDSECFLMNILLYFFRNIPWNLSRFPKIRVLWRYLSFPLRELLFLLGISPTFFVIAQLKN